MQRQRFRTSRFTFLLLGMVAALALAGATHLAAQSGGDGTPPAGNRCYACHIEHAARDNVFLQFYPLLADAAGVTVD